MAVVPLKEEEEMPDADNAMLFRGGVADHTGVFEILAAKIRGWKKKKKKKDGVSRTKPGGKLDHKQPGDAGIAIKEEDGEYETPLPG
jgi:hypothetical protein